MTTCSECQKPVYAKGLCSAHYQKARYHGELPSTAARQCEHCGEPMTGGNAAARYCSRSCIDKARLQRNRETQLVKLGERRCLECGTVIPDTVTLKAKCCSRECGIAWQNRKRAEGKRAAWAAESLRCEQCGEPIPIPVSGRRRTKYCSVLCKRRAKSADWRVKSPGYMRQYLYGLSPERYEEMLAEQDGKCAICRTDDWPGKDRRPHVDHDHKTGRVRGILCGACNNGLGNFGDDPARLRAAADYLERLTN